LVRAPGLEDLDVDDIVVSVFASDGAHLQELQEVNTDARLEIDELEAVFAVAPRLQVLNTGMTGTCAELLPFLRNDPPYGALRISALDVNNFDAAGTLAFAAAVATHESLQELSLSDSRWAFGLNALVDAAAERSLAVLTILGCSLNAESVSALARLLQRGSLIELRVMCAGFPHAQESSVPVLSAALRTCRTLKHLALRLNPGNGASRRTVTELLDAVAALPALTQLSLGTIEVQDVVDAGRAIGALLRGNLPNLRIVRVYNCHLGDEGLAPLLDGLAVNTHLHELMCFGNDPSTAFQRNRLAPALAALAVRAALDA
jgi:hypothetical protein